MLFRAFGILRRRHDAVLKLVGEGPWAARYEQELAAAGLADAVEFLGYRYDVPELTAAADVAVLTSVKEGIPRALMQAAAVGVPVVATDVKGTREVVVNAQTGFLVPLDDAEALADRLGRLLDDAELRRQMGTRAVQYAREQELVARGVVNRLSATYDTAKQQLKAEARNITSNDVNRTLVYLRLAQMAKTQGDASRLAWAVRNAQSADQALDVPTGAGQEASQLLNLP